MEAYTELEEGEACYYKDTDEGNVYLDSPSYIDERIQHALGHFQKDFEGGVTAENLGARFGGYGSFLPTYECSPCFRSHSKIPQRNHNSPKSPINVHIEAVSHNTEAPSNVPPSVRLGKAVAPSVDNSVLKGRRISSGDAAERCNLKDNTTKKTGNSTDQRPLKIPIKMKSHTLAQKKAAIYRDLGLDISPSSSMGNSPVESEGKPPVSQENTENPPTAIIQVMTSCHIPGGVLISPLHESFLSLIEEEKVIQDNRMVEHDAVKCNDNMISKMVEYDALKCKVDQVPQKYETHQKVTDVYEGKNKSKGVQIPGKAEAVARKDSFGGSNDAMITDKGSAGIGLTHGIKMNKSKSLKDKKVKHSNKDSLKEKKSEWKVDGPPGNSAMKDANINNFKKQSVFGAKVKERPSGNKVVNQLLDGPCIKDASGSFHIAENGPAPEMIASAVATPQLIAEWVCCDSCEQWRLLPTGIKPNQLPEKWFCSMLNWLPGMNSCDFSQDDTTNALYALESHANGTAIGVSSADALQCGPSLKKSDSDVKSDQGRKKHVIKEKTMPRINILSKSGKLNAPESRKNKRLIDMNQHPADSDPMKKLIDEKDMPKEKEKHINGGDRKHIKLKRKMDADQCRSGTPKKSKTDVCHADKQLNPGMGHEKVALNSGNGLPTKANGSLYGDEQCGEEFRHHASSQHVTLFSSQGPNSSKCRTNSMHYEAQNARGKILIPNQKSAREKRKSLDLDSLLDEKIKNKKCPFLTATESMKKLKRELLELGEAVGTQSRGLTQEQISLLPVSKYKGGFFLRKKSRDERCVICQMEYKRGDKRITLPCKHVYHASCGNRWLSINKACPICYTEVFADKSKHK